MTDPLSSQALEKLPHSLRTLAGEIGNQQVLLRLLVLTRDTPWKVFRGAGDGGCDFLLLDPGAGRQIRIATQTRLKAGEGEGVCFNLAKARRQGCDFLVGCLLDCNDYFVVPKSELTQDLPAALDFEQLDRLAPYQDAWHLILPTPAGGSPDAGVPEPEAAASGASDWPELEALIEKDEAARRQIRADMESQQFVRAVEEQSEKLFWARDVQEGLGEDLETIKALFAVWDPVVFERVKQLAEATKLNTIWTIKTKVISVPGTPAYALFWETHFEWMGSDNWYGVELRLDRAYQPCQFRVECKEPDYWIETEPTLEALKAALAQAYQLGQVRGQGRPEKPGWILRSEVGKRY